MADRPAYPGTPRWVKISALVGAVLVALVVFVVATGLGGPHGPGRHLPSGESGALPADMRAAPASPGAPSEDGR